MKRSIDRILTTFTGSLARPPDLLEMMQAKESGRPYDQKAYKGQVSSAVAEVVRKQVEAGVDIVCDGEQGKSGFYAYVSERLTGFELREVTSRAGPWAGSREALAFPEYYQRSRDGNTTRFSSSFHCHRELNTQSEKVPVQLNASSFWLTICLVEPVPS